MCAGGLDRSPTAVDLFKGSKEYQAKSCGIHPLISAPMTKQNLEWADQVFVMEPYQKAYILENFPLIMKNKQDIIILDVPNEYVRTDPKLKELLRIKLKKAGFSL